MRKHPHDNNAPPWYQDAVFYGVDLARFNDSNADGYGDLKGLTRKLDYLQWLGIDAIWLLPFYRSPREDAGYDVVDHYEIDPRLGTTGDFVAFLPEAEHRNIHVLIDLVINHTSSQHRWFQESLQAGSAKRGWYIWTDDLESVPDYPVVFPPSQKTTWTWKDVAGAWYLHHFHDFEPDLNTQHPEVQAEIRNMVEYWIRLGVTGFRVDGAPFFGQKRSMDDAAAHELLGNIHEWAQDIHEQTCLIPEADLDADQLEPYASKGNAQMLFNFLASQYAFLAMATEEAEPLARMLDLLPEGPSSFRWLNFLRHHDELSLERLTEEERHRVMAAFSADPETHIYGRGSRRRLAPMLEGDRRRMEMAFSILFALPGTPLIIGGDEIGMGEHLDLPERDAARLPIQWTPEKPNGGFSDAPPESLITPVLADGPFGVESVNVADQRADDSSFLCWVRNLIGIRKQASRWLNKGVPTVEIPAPSVIVLTYASADDSTMLVIAHNLSGSEIRLGLDGSNDISSCLTSTDTRFLHDQSLALGPYGYAWWEQSSAPAFSPQYETVSMESETA